jgi:hypothetical protein
MPATMKVTEEPDFGPRTVRVNGNPQTPWTPSSLELSISSLLAD